jgi:hypothetical protein
MRIAIIPAIAACCTAALIAIASPALADDQTYLADLQAAGVPTTLIGGISRPGAPLDTGYQICAKLRAGEPPEVAATQFSWLNQWGPAIVGAAQHDLCPDTLH